MRKFLFLLITSLSSFILFAQLTVLPSGGNKKAWVGERVGLVDITLTYSRPGVKGREGKIWGQLVPAGFNYQGFGSSKAAPWRAGANENTTIEFSGDVKIEGQPLKAGKYALFLAYDDQEPTLIFSHNSDAWGSFYYDEHEDALRVKIKTQKAEQSVEWLRYEFADQKESSANIVLEWEKLRFPFHVETDYLHDQLEVFRHELKSSKGFSWEAWNQAATWSLTHNTNFEQALAWSDSATSLTFGGNNSFTAWSIKAQLLDKVGRSAESEATMKKALPLANMQELHQYGRMLIMQKKNKEALEVFKMNLSKYPNQFTTLVGMSRGLSANADYKNALKYAQQALPMAPNDPNKNLLIQSIEKLKKGEDMN